MDLHMFLIYSFSKLMEPVILHSKQQGCFSKLRRSLGGAGQAEGATWPEAGWFHVGSEPSEGLGHFWSFSENWEYGEEQCSSESLPPGM